MNVVILEGNLANDVDVRVNNDGIKIVKGTLAVNRDYSKKKDCDFITFVVIGNSADFVQKYGYKGTRTLIRGTWNHSSYKDKNGNTRVSDACYVDSIKFFDKKKVEEADEPIEKPVEKVEPNLDSIEVTDDDLPF